MPAPPASGDQPPVPTPDRHLLGNQAVRHNETGGEAWTLSPWSSERSGDGAGERGWRWPRWWAWSEGCPSALSPPATAPLAPSRDSSRHTASTRSSSPIAPLPQLNHLPEVASVTDLVSPYNGQPTCACTGSINPSTFNLFGMSSAALARTVNLVTGRMPNLSDPHEVLASFPIWCRTTACTSVPSSRSLSLRRATKRTR